MIKLICALAFCVALSAGHVAHAAVYILIQNATTTIAAPPPLKTTIQSGISGAPASTVTPQVVVGVNLATGACTAQIVGSNDGINWVNVGSTIVVAAGAITGGLASGAALTATWNYWGATITSIAGTGATCTVTVSG